VAAPGSERGLIVSTPIHLFYVGALLACYSSTQPRPIHFSFTLWTVLILWLW